MFNWFRNQRKAIVPVATAVFFCGLFSFYCPHCLAKMLMEANSAIGKMNVEVPCSHMGAGRSGPVQSDKHCNGSCACGGKAVLTTSQHPVTLSFYKRSPDTRMPVLNGLSWHGFPVSYLPFTIGRPYKPDRACYSPLERNCVLLN